MRKGETLELHTSDGTSFEAYVAGPDGARRGILILHEWWGLLEHNRDWADAFAEQGYKVVVVDLFDGRVTDEVAEAQQWVKELDQNDADARFAAALDLLDRPHRAIAAYGVSFGGRQALCASFLAPDKISATVVGYCRMETDAEKLSELSGPVFAIYAEQERNWPAKQEAFEAAMAANGKRTESIGFDAAHGFSNPTSPRYDAQAAGEAWEATLDFLDRELIA